MTIAVFNKGNFVDFWLNEPSDKDWVQRTIAAKSWLVQDVEVYLYELNRSGSEMLSFDENKNLQVITSSLIVVNDVEETVYSVDQTYNKIPFFIDGDLV